MPERRGDGDQQEEVELVDVEAPGPRGQVQGGDERGYDHEPGRRSPGQQERVGSESHYQPARRDREGVACVEGGGQKADGEYPAHQKKGMRPIA